MTKKKRKNKKSTEPKQVSPQDIIQEIEAKLAADSRKTPIGPIVSLIKKCLPSKDYNHHVDKLLEYTKSKPWFTQLSLEAVSRVSQKQKASDQAFIRQLVIENRRRCAIPLEESRPVLFERLDDQEELKIKDWIIESRGKGANSDWCRAALVSLLTIQEGQLSERTIPILHNFLEVMFPRKQKTNKKNRQSAIANARSTQQYVKRLASVLMPTKPSLPKLAWIRDLTDPVLTLLKRCETELSRAKSDLFSKERDLQQVSSIKATLEAEKRELVGKTAVLEKDIEQLRLQLQQEQENLKKLRIWWEEKVESDKGAHLNKFKAQLQHEVSEAMICLAGDEPNVSMALDRLKRIKQMSVESGGKS